MVFVDWLATTKVSSEINVMAMQDYHAAIQLQMFGKLQLNFTTEKLFHTE